MLHRSRHHGLCREAGRAGADGFLTTEKDAVKLDALQAKLPNLAVARLSLELENAQQVLTTILDKVKTGEVSDPKRRPDRHGHLRFALGSTTARATYGASVRQF